MKVYRITIEDGFGEKFVVSFWARSVKEALQHIETLNDGWNVSLVEAV